MEKLKKIKLIVSHLQTHNILGRTWFWKGGAKE